MKFKIGPWTYRVEITSDKSKLVDEAGRTCDGRCCWSDRVIFIDEYLPLEQRHETLMHELAEAFEHHYGSVADHESLMNRQSTISTDINAQYERQGGMGALARLSRNGVVNDGADTRFPTMAYAAQCANCTTMVAMGSIKNSPPHFDASTKSVVIDRSFVCENCDRKTSWLEVATPTGLPSGRLIGVPSIDGASVQV